MMMMMMVMVMVMMIATTAQCYVCVCVCVCVCADATEFGRESNMALDDMSSDQVLEAVKTLSQKSA